MAGGGIYKKGQGYWTRVMSAIGLFVLTLFGMNWLWQALEGVRVGDVQPQFIQAGAIILLGATVAMIGYYLIGKKRSVVEFMIATEGEMKKVHWSTRREILGSTWVVIGLTLFIALFCLVADLLFQSLFKWMSVLHG